MTTIGASLRITGEVTSQEDITIHGSVTGQIRMKDGTLLVAPKGHIDAEVHGLHQVLCLIECGRQQRKICRGARFR